MSDGQFTKTCMKCETEYSIMEEHTCEPMTDEQKIEKSVKVLKDILNYEECYKYTGESDCYSYDEPICVICKAKEFLRELEK